MANIVSERDPLDLCFSILKVTLKKSFGFWILYNISVT